MAPATAVHRRDLRATQPKSAATAARGAQLVLISSTAARAACCLRRAVASRTTRKLKPGLVRESDRTSPSRLKQQEN